MKATIYSALATIAISAFSLKAVAQQKVKDGTVTGSSSLPHAGAIQELESSNKGQLLPRVALTSTTVWGLNGTAVAGMQVYNTSNSISAGDPKYPIIGGNTLPQTLGVGVYYWDGFGWVATSAYKDIQNPESYTNPIVTAYKQSTGEIATNNNPFNITGFTETRDISGAFDPATGIFTAPIDATYIFDVSAVAIFSGNWDRAMAVIISPNKAPAGSTMFGAVPNIAINQSLSGGPHQFGSVFLFPPSPTNGTYWSGANGRLPHTMNFSYPAKLLAGEQIRFRAVSYNNSSPGISHMGITSFKVDITNYE